MKNITSSTNKNANKKEEEETTTTTTTTTRESGSSSYTAKLSNEFTRLQTRTMIRQSILAWNPQSSLLDIILGYISILTGIMIVFILVLAGIFIIIPSKFISKLSKLFFSNGSGGSGGVSNISMAQDGSQTALKTLSARAQFYFMGSTSSNANININNSSNSSKDGSVLCGYGPDYLAPRLMAQTSLIGESAFGAGAVSDLYLRLCRWNYVLTGRLFRDQFARLLGVSRFGVEAFLQVRTCWLDDCVEAFVQKHTTTEKGKKEVANVNVVILGAGYDTRCYRLNLSERGVQTYEVDAPGTHASKLHALRKAGISTDQTTYVSCDFSKQNWMEQLLQAGFQSKINTTTTTTPRPTLFVWEGVSYYVHRDVVKSTLKSVYEHCAIGSCIGFDYVDRTWALTPTIKRAMKHEPWIFGMTNSEPQELLEECNQELMMDNDAATNAGNSNGNDDDDNDDGLVVLDHLKYQECIRRYLPKHYDGRPMGYLGDFGGLLLVGTQNKKEG